MKRFLAWCVALLLAIAPTAAQDFSFSLLPAKGPTLGGANLWTGPNSQPPCPLTPASTIAIAIDKCTSDNTKGVGIFTFTLNQDSIMAFPTGLPATGGLQFGFKFDHAGHALTFANGYSFPAAGLCQPGDASCTAGQPKLSTAKDEIWCVSNVGGTVVDCNTGMLAMTPVNTGFAFLAHKGASGANSPVTAGIDTSSADLIVVSLSWWTGGTTPTLLDAVGGNSNIWSLALSDTNSPTGLQLWFVRPLNRGIGHTFTCSGSGVYCSINAAAFSGSVASPLDQTNSAENVSTATLAAGSVTPAQANELIIMALSANSGTGYSAGSGFTLTDEEDAVGGTNYGGAMAYLIQTAACSPTCPSLNPAWSWSSNATATAGIATLK